MKRIYILFFLLVACGCFKVQAEDETSYLSAIGISQSQVSRQGRTVELKLSVDLSQAKIRAQHTVALTPALVSADGRREVCFPPVVIDGKVRHKVYLRAQQLESVDLPPYHNDSAQVILCSQGKAQRYDYAATVPYERWMLDGKVELREVVHGCINCHEGKARQDLLGHVLPAFVPQFRYEMMVPEPEPVKVRVENRTARLQFRWDSYQILPDYMNNRAELDSVIQSIEVVKQNPDVTITSISITGYASPEGSVAYNLRLSQNRADALARYVQKDTHTDARLWQVRGMGEDWEGLRRQVEAHPDLLKADEVLRIIDECEGDQDQCEKRFKALVPPTIYKRMLNEMYGPLRRNEYRIEYNVRNFNLEEAKQMILENPKLLSLNEMYTVAGSYDKHSAEYRRSLHIAAETYPDRAEAIVNVAVLEKEAGNLDSAIRILENAAVKDDPEVLNVLGVVYALGERYEDAHRVLSLSAGRGNARAAHNLKQVEGVMADL